MELRTRIFDLYHGNYDGLVELAQTMGIATSQVYRVKKGERRINGKFIVGAVRAFPGYKLDDLFYIGRDEQIR